MAEESTAGQTPAPEATPEAPAVDYAAIDAELRQLGDGVSLENIADRARDWRSQMGKSQQEAAEARKQLEWVKPLQTHMQNDPKFADHMRTSIDSYFNPETGEREYVEREQTDVPAELRQVSDPAMAAIHEMKTRLDFYEQQNMMGALKREFGAEITPDVEQRIYTQIAETGINDPKHHFIYMKGNEVVNRTEPRSTGASHGGRLPAGGGGGVQADVTPDKSVAEMDAREHDNHAEARIREIMGG